jgi:hypothetical protein
MLKHILKVAVSDTTMLEKVQMPVQKKALQIGVLMIKMGVSLSII